MFLNEAPDDRYLAKKVALIFGVVGACHREEFANITLKDIEAHGKMLLIKIPNTKNKKPRSFVVEGDFLRIVQKYMSQRSQKAKTDRFFQNYQKGKCTAQAIGINKFGNMPKEIELRFLVCLMLSTILGTASGGSRLRYWQIQEPI